VVKLYLLSGLGADERVFTYLRLNGIEQKHIRWIPPQKNEPISRYASRLLDQIEEKAPINLLGVSFGGIIAQEVAQYIDCQKLFIISSIKHPSEMPFSLRFLRKTRFDKFIRPGMLDWVKGLGWSYFFGIQTKEEQQLLRAIAKDTDTKFLAWAIEQVMQWKGVEKSPEVIHIHGTADRVFPIRYIKNCTSIPNGGHFMIVNKAREVSHMIEKVFDISINQEAPRDS